MEGAKINSISIFIWSYDFLKNTWNLVMAALGLKVSLTTIFKAWALKVKSLAWYLSKSLLPSL